MVSGCSVKSITRSSPAPPPHPNTVTTGPKNLENTKLDASKQVVHTLMWPCPLILFSIWFSQWAKSDTYFFCFSFLEKIGISILHQVWSWVSGLMSRMVSRRQPIYRLVCMADVTSSASVVHQSTATQRSLTSASQHSTCPHSFCLPLSGCLPPHTHFLSCLTLRSVCC